MGTCYQYDALGRLTQVGQQCHRSYSPDPWPADTIITHYGYDAVGNRTVMTDANGYVTTYAYDALNRRIAMTDPLSQTTQYGYNLLGQPTVMTDANGLVTRYAYNEINRLTDIDYPLPSTGSGQASTPDVSFEYDDLGRRIGMTDGSGSTSYDYDPLNRLTEVTNGASQTVGYRYDAAGNRLKLIYPDNREVNYRYDDGYRLDSVTDWQSSTYTYTYNSANRLTQLNLPNGLSSGYSYDKAGRLTELAHTATDNELLARYQYQLNQVGQRTRLTETLQIKQTVPSGAFLEQDGLVMIETEHFTAATDTGPHSWQINEQNATAYGQYIEALPNIDQLASPLAGPTVAYPILFEQTGLYTLYLRGFTLDAAADSVFATLTPDSHDPLYPSQLISVTGFVPNQWTWASRALAPQGHAATFIINRPGVYTLSLHMREDGLLLDRLLLHQGGRCFDDNPASDCLSYDSLPSTPDSYDPYLVENPRQSQSEPFVLDRVIDYEYDDLYRLTQATYSTGELYQYDYDPVGNRLQQIIDGDTTDYTYDAANRLEAATGSSASTSSGSGPEQITDFSYDANGNRLTSDVMTNTWDTANRLRESSSNAPSPSTGSGQGQVVSHLYDGLGHRVAQTVDGITTTTYALDVAIGLAEVIFASPSPSTGSGNNAYLHLPGVIMAENAASDTRYLLSDGLGSVRHVVDEAGDLVAYQEFDPYGNPVTDNTTGNMPYGFTGEWWQDDLDLLHLRARWYDPHTGTFLSRDAVESEPPYQYVRGNVVNLTDPSGNAPPPPPQPTPEPRTPEPPPQPTGTPVPDGWEPPTYPTLVPPLPDLNDRLPFPPPDPEPEPEPFQLPPGASLNIEKFDGIVFGGSVSLSGLFYFGDNEVRPFDTNMNYFGLCLPDMGRAVKFLKKQ